MKLSSFIHYQRYLGLTDIDYSSLRECYVVNGNWISHFSQMVVQVILTAGLIEALLRKGVLYMDMESRSINLFHNIVVLFIPVTQIIVGIWIRFQQETQRVLLNKLSSLVVRLQVDTERLQYPRLLYRLWLSTSAFYTANIIAFSWLVWNPDRHWTYLLAFASFFVLLIRSNFLIICYTCLVHEVKLLLKVQADQLKKSPNTTRQLSHNLCLHDELLLLCRQEIAEVFSGAFIMIFMFTLLDATCLLYAAAMTERFSVWDIHKLLVWVAPLVIYLTMPLVVNDLASQVSNTRPHNNQLNYLWIYTYSISIHFTSLNLLNPFGKKNLTPVFI